MITAIDSSVLWAIIKREDHHDLWLTTLMRAASEGPLIISPIAFAEVSPLTADHKQLSQFLKSLDIAYEPISPESAHLCGSTFKRYRQAGGPREHLVPDFMIAAHAQIQADRLAATDRGYLRRWFPDLVLLTSL